MVSFMVAVSAVKASVVLYFANMVIKLYTLTPDFHIFSLAINLL